jgi:hypothetical protein
MPKLPCRCSGLEYDFALEFNGRSPFGINDEVKNGIRDDEGRVFYFDGAAVVVATESKHSNGTKRSTVYIRIFRRISP